MLVFHINGKTTKDQTNNNIMKVPRSGREKKNTFQKLFVNLNDEFSYYFFEKEFSYYYVASSMER